MGLTGLLLFGFTVGHLIGNFLLMVGPEAFNVYAKFLAELGHGAFVPLADLGLVLIIGFHVYNGIKVALFGKHDARPSNYVKSVDAGGKSRKSFSSTTMIASGCIILIFVICHVMQFKFHILTTNEAPVTVMIHNESYLNLFGFVINEFANGWIAAGYILVMMLLGIHLKHGIWSAFQSLGLLNHKYDGQIKLFGTVSAILLALGFIALPACIHFGNSHYQDLNQQYMQTYQVVDTQH